MSKNQLPAGWTEKRIQRVIEHYDRQTDDEAVADIGAMADDEDLVVFVVPRELADDVRRLIADYEARKAS